VARKNFNMEAYVIKDFGQFDVFHQMDIPAPEVLPGYILIRVKATSVNPVDYKIRAGVLPDISPVFPAVLHGDVAGIVEAVGEGVTDFKIGDEVYACAGGVRGSQGALAELMLADASLVAKKPASLSMAEAAALPLVSITAWSGLITRAKVQPGQKVLVYGGTGGVGHIVVQLAKWSGATVIATASTEEKSQIAKAIGADDVILYRQQSVQDYVQQYTDGEGFDIVFDTVGNDNLQSAFSATKLGGQVVSILALSQQDLTLMHVRGLTLHVVFMLLPLLYGRYRASHGEILQQLAEIVDNKQLRPLVDCVFPIREIARAHQKAESGKAIGKVVVEW
jgi:NADPH:quinone reductase